MLAYLSLRLDIISNHFQSRNRTIGFTTLSLPDQCPTIIKHNIHNVNLASLNATDQRNSTSNQLQQHQTEMIEYGDVYFFYRPNVGSEEVKSIDDALN